MGPFSQWVLDLYLGRAQVLQLTLTMALLYRAAENGMAAAGA